MRVVVRTAEPSMALRGREGRGPVRRRVAVAVVVAAVVVVLLALAAETATTVRSGCAGAFWLRPRQQQR